MYLQSISRDAFVLSKRSQVNEGTRKLTSQHVFNVSGELLLIKQTHVNKPFGCVCIPKGFKTQTSGTNLGLLVV